MTVDELAGPMAVTAEDEPPKKATRKRRGREGMKWIARAAFALAVFLHLAYIARTEPTDEDRSSPPPPDAT